MRNTVKKMISILLAAAMLFTGSSVIFAEDNAPKVMLNGQYVAFTDASPENVNGRIMVPFRPILEALGASVEWNQENLTVTATKGDEVLRFTIGQPNVAITKGKAESAATMDVVPYVKNGRTYVGTRFMAEALDYAVGWDQQEQTVIIIDFDEIFGNINEDFSIVTLASSNNATNMEKTYETAMKMNLTLALAAEALGLKDDVTLSAVGDIDALTKGLDADMNMKLNLDIKQVVDLLVADSGEMTAEEKAQVESILDSLKSIEMKIKMDGESGDLYFQCPLIAALRPGESVTAETWYKMNMYDFYETMGIDMREIMDVSTTGQLDPASVMKSMKDVIVADMDMGVETYDVLTGVYGALKDVLGDEAFAKTTSAGVNTYTSEFTGETILNGFLANLNETLANEFATMDTAERQELTDLLKGISGKIVLSEKDGLLQESQISFTMDIEGVKMNMDMKSDQKTSDVTMTFDIPNTGKMDLKVNSVVKESTKTVDVTIPAGAQVIDLMTTGL